MDWQAIEADPRFQRLHREKTLFLVLLLTASLTYYFLLPLGAAYFQDILRIRIWGPINLGILFALSQFLVVWVIAYVYVTHANRKLDILALEIADDARLNVATAKTS